MKEMVFFGGHARHFVQSFSDSTRSVWPVFDEDYSLGVSMIASEITRLGYLLVASFIMKRGINFRGVANLSSKCWDHGGRRAWNLEHRQLRNADLPHLLPGTIATIVLHRPRIKDFWFHRRTSIASIIRDGMLPRQEGGQKGEHTTLSLVTRGISHRHDRGPSIRLDASPIRISSIHGDSSYRCVRREFFNDRSEKSLGQPPCSSWRRGQFCRPNNTIKSSRIAHRE